MVNKYEFKKGSVKFLKAAVAVVLAGLAAHYGNNAVYLALAPILAFGGNFVKHKWNTDLKIV